jgi:transcriptional regulator with XRE-family HTH domain
MLSSYSSLSDMVRNKVVTTTPGERLREAMNKNGVKATELARRSGISSPTIYHLLNDRREMTLVTMQALAGALHVSPSWLAWGE